MTRAIDVQHKTSPAHGYDMVAGAHEIRSHPSLAEGLVVSGLADGNAAAGSPGANLGTGMNADVYTPTIEAV